MNRRQQARLLIAIAGAGWLTAAAGSGQSPLTPSAIRNHQAIRYQQTPPEDAVAMLDDRLRRGEARLEFDSTTGYLRSVLKALNVSEDSQILVFSKTSFQARRIGPDNPRALFFNDTAAVGWVRGGEVLEFVAQDPRQGAIFYTLEQTPAAKPQFHRDLSCVQCHTWEATGNVPGHVPGEQLRRHRWSGVVLAGLQCRPPDPVRSPLGRVVRHWPARDAGAHRQRPGAAGRASGGHDDGPRRCTSRRFEAASTPPAIPIPIRATSSRLWCWSTRHGC